MFEVRIHGRGGQGVVSAAELLAVAAFEEGRYAQAFPTFGSERMGSPVISFCRIDEQPIRIHEPIAAPDGLIVQDPTLVHQVRLFEGVGPRTYLLVNTAHELADLGLSRVERGLAAGHSVCVPATELAREVLGRPLPNTALLGAFAALTQVVALSSLVAAIHRAFPEPVATRNEQVAELAYRRVFEQTGLARHA